MGVGVAPANAAADHRVVTSQDVTPFGCRDKRTKRRWQSRKWSVSPIVRSPLTWRGFLLLLVYVETIQ